jgi:hypothetical protein
VHRSQRLRPRLRLLTWALVAVWAALVSAAAQAQAASVRAAPVFVGRAASAPPELAVSFEQASVVASELTAGGYVVFWSVALEPQGYFNRVVRRSGVAVADALGEARFDLEDGDVPLKSVWAVADVESGAFAVAAPAGFRLREIPFPGNAFQVGPPGLVNRLRNGFEEVDLLLVRPGVGAWRLHTWDTAAEDLDGHDDDRVTAGIEAFQAVDDVGPPPPDRFAAGDVLVVLRPQDLRFAATRLIGPPGGGGSQ